MCFRLANEVSLDEGRHPLTLRKASYSFPELARGEYGHNPKEKKEKFYRISSCSTFRIIAWKCLMEGHRRLGSGSMQA